MNKAIISKYQKPTPRYTSYPTVPFWNTNPPTPSEWLRDITSQIKYNNPASIYIHLPFCESLCTYCACHKRITKNHKVEVPYINSLLQEWEIYKQKAFSRPIRIQELHLGGGTPTFFSTKALEKLIVGITADQNILSTAKFSFEAHPWDTTEAHLEVLYKLNFRRISLGVQEFSPIILAAIHRKQNFQQIEKITQLSRDLGYHSVNYDLLYGLPYQSIDDIHRMMDKVALLRPDRIAFYGYAHVPWTKPSQRAYAEKDLPTGIKRWNLFVQGKKRLKEMGYHQIGMDHFALETDELYQASKSGKLHRNFMGYTPHPSYFMLGLGASSISESENHYVQNEKHIEEYQNLVQENKLPIVKGHRLNREDRILKYHINNLMCKYKTSWKEHEWQTPALQQGLKRLKEMQAEGLVRFSPNEVLKVTSKGRPFVRNIALMLDAHYWNNQGEEERNKFSKSL